MNCCSKVVYNTLKISFICGISLASVGQAKAGKSWDYLVNNMEEFDGPFLHAWCQKKMQSPKYGRSERWKLKDETVTTLEKVHSLEPLNLDKIKEILADGKVEDTRVNTRQLQSPLIPAPENITTTTTTRHTYNGSADAYDSRDITEPSIEATVQFHMSDLEAIINALKEQGSPKSDYERLEVELDSLRNNFFGSNSKEPKEKELDEPSTSETNMNIHQGNSSDRLSTSTEGAEPIVYMQIASRLKELREQHDELAQADVPLKELNPLIEEMRALTHNAPKLDEEKMKAFLEEKKQGRLDELEGLIAAHMEEKTPLETYVHLISELNDLSNEK